MKTLFSHLRTSLFSPFSEIELYSFVVPIVIFCIDHYSDIFNFLAEEITVQPQSFKNILSFLVYIGILLVVIFQLVINAFSKKEISEINRRLFSYLFYGGTSILFAASTLQSISAPHTVFDVINVVILITMFIRSILMLLTLQYHNKTNTEYVITKNMKTDQITLLQLAIICIASAVIYLVTFKENSPVTSLALIYVYVLYGVKIISSRWFNYRRPS